VIGAMTTGTEGGRNRERGFSLLELVFVVVMIGLLIAVAIRHLQDLPARAERDSTGYLLGVMRSAVGIKFAQYMANREFTAVRQLPKLNPMGLLAQLPDNYIGERRDGHGEPGTWYWDPGAEMLVYQVRGTEDFQGGARNPPRARFRITLVSDRAGRIEGATIAALEPFQWRQANREVPGETGKTGIATMQGDGK
jgi:prepilin-type N-terminal cleavage/methylation domain-containing protein